MQIALITFDGFTDIDLYLPWDLLHRPQRPDWEVRILGTEAEHVSSTGLSVRTHATVDEARSADVVLIGSGQTTRTLIEDGAWLARLELDPERQMIGSMCSGALILAALGLLDGLSATTYPTAAGRLREFGVDVVEAPFVQHGNIATAAGCLAAQHLCSWVVESTLGPDECRRMLLAIQPVGEGLAFADAARVATTDAEQAPRHRPHRRRPARA
jgi:transcriptional regulator GlxA family with amidase domain